MRKHIHAREINFIFLKSIKYKNVNNLMNVDIMVSNQLEEKLVRNLLFLRNKKHTLTIMFLSYVDSTNISGF